MGLILKILAIIICGFILLAGAASVWGWVAFKSPGPLKKEISIIIKRGGVGSISQTLYKAGVLDSPILLNIAARLINSDKTLKAGEYAFIPRISPEEVLNLLQLGKTVVRRVTFAEGLSAADILNLLHRTEGLQGTVSLIPEEGTLLPETYHFSFGDHRQEIVRRMAVSMQKLVAILWHERIPHLPFISSEEAVILASIVEKETAIASERPRVAAVFINRIRKGMRLQSDPTVVYGLTQGVGSLGMKLTRMDLKFSSPYNTYLIRGLPPGPISSPGRASLHAVMNPSQTNELYFVADGQGGHLFAKSLKEHNRNVARWRKINRTKN
jgi:UPF0755 protein